MVRGQVRSGHQSTYAAEWRIWRAHGLGCGGGGGATARTGFGIPYQARRLVQACIVEGRLKFKEKGAGVELSADAESSGCTPAAPQTTITKPSTGAFDLYSSPYFVQHAISSQFSAKPVSARLSASAAWRGCFVMFTASSRAESKNRRLGVFLDSWLLLGMTVVHFPRQLPNLLAA